MKPMWEGEFQRLLQVLLDGTAAPDDLRRLDSLLADEPEALRAYSRLLMVDALLCWRSRGRECGAGAGVTVAPSANRAAAANRSPVLGFLGATWTYLSGSEVLLGYLAASIFTCAALLGGLLIRVSPNAPQLAREEPAAEQSRPAELAKNIVARVTGEANACWRGLYHPVVGHGLLKGMKLELVEGLAEITYLTGTKIVLQAPTKFEVQDANSAGLQLGKLVARVEGGRGKAEGGRGKEEIENLSLKIENRQLKTAAADASNPQSAISNPSPFPLLPSPFPSLNSQLFAVHTPAATVTDLGTEFGVEVAEDGRTQSHVFAGKVVFASSGSGDKPGQQVVLGENQSARVGRPDERGGASIVVGDSQIKPESFVRRLPRKATAPGQALRRLASDSANQSAYIGGWKNGDDGGGGWATGWMMKGFGQDSEYFIGSAANNDAHPAPDKTASIDTEGLSFGLRASKGLAEAFRGLSFDGLPVGATFMIDLDTGRTAKGSGMGFCLQNSAGQSRIEFSLGQGRQTYSLHDEHSTDSVPNSKTRWDDSKIPQTDKGLHIELTRLDAEAYRMKVVRLEDNQVYTFDRRLRSCPGGSDISRFRVWNFRGGDETLYFNNIRVIAPRSDAKKSADKDGKKGNV